MTLPARAYCAVYALLGLNAACALPFHQFVEALFYFSISWLAWKLHRERSSTSPP